MVAAKENKVIYGLENAHYAKLTFGTNGVPEFSTPTALKGAVELALEPQSNSVEFAADNDSQYFSEEENQATAMPQKLVTCFTIAMDLVRKSDQKLVRISVVLKLDSKQNSWN
ncbi:MAG: hypothetical protein E6Z68_16510 [Enterococcus casseliflavus]|nr:hypothetical protein [Enterococcus casseliflavus]